MKRKIKSAKGFTLAELLIVVAIIAVLVAIGIPIFTSQLEKSREAVDLSDVRSAYAEVMMAAITGDTTAYYTKDANQTIYDSENSVYTITVRPLKQKQSGWQTAEPITIGGVSSKAGEPYWKGQPGPNGYCIVTYHPPVSGRDEYVSFYWEGGSDGTDVNPTPDPSNPTITPDPSTPGDNNGGNDSTNGDFSSIIKNYGSGEWPEDNSNSPHVGYAKGEIVYYKGTDSYYIAAGDCYEWFNGWYKTPVEMGRFIPLTHKVHTYSEVTEVGVSSPSIKTLEKGDFYQGPAPDNILYVYNGGSSTNAVPTGTNVSSDWVVVIRNSNKYWGE